jgi:alpha-galactosidase
MSRRARRSASLATFALSCLSLFVAPTIASAATVAAAGDASIAHDEGAGTWTLAAGGARLTLTLDAARDFAVARLETASGINWASAAIPDTVLHIGAQPLALGNRAAGFALLDVTVETERRRLQLNATFDLPRHNLRVTRHYVIVSGSPTFEAWTTYTPQGASPSLSNLSALHLSVPAGTIRSLSGLQGDTADVPAESPVFTLQSHTLASGGHFAIGAAGRSSETAVPWIAIDGARDELYAALMWSGSWSLTADRSGASIALAVDLGSMTTTVRQTMDGPHVVFGVTPGGLPEATSALRSYVLDGIRDGRTLEAPVIYNTWFAYGIAIDEPSMRDEIDRAAALGAEIFVLDAGWYAGAGATGAFDFDAGLGSWTPDAGRFPGGVRPLRDYAHAHGMKFGLWVEPERVNLALVGAPGPDAEWLAMHDGEYGSDHAAQICLAPAAARRWLLDWLTPLLDEVQPDYLKWDNNMWVNCTREGHEHGATDGNFAHINGLYEILGTLRARYPDMLVENVSGGGNRLDLGMLRYSDVGWMDDRTAPSALVRHNIEGLSAVFPPAYLLSFVTDHESEPLHDSPDLPLYIRSRMTGVLGLCFRGSEFAEGEAATLAREIEIYKATRTTLTNAAGSLLTAQAAVADGPPWDVLQATSSDRQDALVYAYQSDMGVDRINVRPIGLVPSATYRVQSVDTGVLGTATGAELMATGIDIRQSPNTAAHILILRVQN